MGSLDLSFDMPTANSGFGEPRNSLIHWCLHFEGDRTNARQQSES
jgi:hypothetical protein